jgi:hypothetical protein
MGLFVYSFIVRLLFIQQPGNTHGIYHHPAFFRSRFSL